MKKMTEGTVQIVPFGRKRIYIVKEWAKDLKVVEFAGLTHPYQVIRETDGYSRTDWKIPSDKDIKQFIKTKMRPLKEVVAEWKKMSKEERAEHQKKMMAKFKRSRPRSSDGRAADL